MFLNIALTNDVVSYRSIVQKPRNEYSVNCENKNGFSNGFSKKSKIINDQLKTNSYIAGLKSIFTSYSTGQHYHSSQEPEFSRHLY